MVNLSNKIDGVILTELKQIYDERGAVLHMFRNDAPEFTTFGECYFSEVQPGAIKAWKRHRIQTQNLAVPIGRICLVITDTRRDSSSKGVIQTFIMGRPNNYNRVSIAPGLWYGFKCISDRPALIANCADMPHQPSESEVCEDEDFDISYEWAQHTTDGLP